METDGLVGIEEETRLAAAPSASGVKAEKMGKRKDGRKRKERSERARSAEARGQRKSTAIGRVGGQAAAWAKEKCSARSR